MSQSPKNGKAEPAIEPRLLSTAAASKYLCLSPYMLRLKVALGEIPVIDVGHFLFDRRDLDTWVDEHKHRKREP